ncbi:MAG: monophosphatase [Bacteroidales bacterium]|jgi:myo-inositol-1(or 4)-monophosphatase|nr:monophosphatase [Bacteroidales bacterium]
MKTYEALTLSVADIAKKAGAFIREQSFKFNPEMAEQKGLHDLVSYVDRTSEEMILAALNKLLPEAGFIAEESGTKAAAEYNWIVDPLDGTTNFVHGVPIYSVSIALQQNDKIVSAVVYEVSRNECFYAWQGSQAFLNEKAIAVSPTITLANSLLATGFPYKDFSRMEGYLQLFDDLMRNSRGLRRLGSAAVDLAYVACGRFEAFYEYGLNPWDVAAGAFIVEQAGGQLADFSSGENWLFGGEICASNKHTHNELLIKIKKYL